METLGSLVDKLSIMNLKLWHMEEVKHSDASDKIIAGASRKIAVLNKQRNALIEEIDEMANKGEFPIYKQVKMY